MHMHIERNNERTEFLFHVSSFTVVVDSLAI